MHAFPIYMSTFENRVQENNSTTSNHIRLAIGGSDVS
jgi:hypothetical protein